MSYQRQTFKDGEPLSASQLVHIEDGIVALDKELAYVKTGPVDITSVSNSIGVAELGRTVDAVEIRWTLNRDAVSQTVDGEPVAVASRAVTLSGLGLTSKRTFTVEVTDEMGAMDSGGTTVDFQNGIYCGSLPDGTVLDSAAILSLTRKLQSGKAATFSAPAGRPTYALPSRYGTPSFNIGGFDYTWNKAATIDFTNASDYTEKYDVWQHPQLVSGTVSVTVK